MLSDFFSKNHATQHMCSWIIETQSPLDAKMSIGSEYLLIFSIESILARLILRVWSSFLMSGMMTTYPVLMSNLSLVPVEVILYPCLW